MTVEFLVQNEEILIGRTVSIPDDFELLSEAIDWVNSHINHNCTIRVVGDIQALEDIAITKNHNFSNLTIIGIGSTPVIAKRIYIESQRRLITLKNICVEADGNQAIHINKSRIKIENVDIRSSISKSNFALHVDNNSFVNITGLQINAAVLGDWVFSIALLVSHRSQVTIKGSLPTGQGYDLAAYGQAVRIQRQSVIYMQNLSIIQSTVDGSGLGRGITVNQSYAELNGVTIFAEKYSVLSTFSSYLLMEDCSGSLLYSTSEPRNNIDIIRVQNLSTGIIKTSSLNPKQGQYCIRGINKGVITTSGNTYTSGTVGTVDPPSPFTSNLSGGYRTT